MRWIWIGSLCLGLAAALVRAQPAPEAPPPVPAPQTGHFLRFRFASGQTQRFHARIAGELEAAPEPVAALNLPEKIRLAVAGEFDLAQRVTRSRAGVATVTGSMPEGRFVVSTKGYRAECTLAQGRSARRVTGKLEKLPFTMLLPQLRSAGPATLQVDRQGQVRSAAGGPILIAGGALPTSQAAEFFGSGLCGLIHLELPRKAVVVGETWDSLLTRQMPVTLGGQGTLRTMPVTVSMGHTLTAIHRSGGRQLATITTEGNIAMAGAALKIGPCELSEAAYTLAGRTVFDRGRGRIVRSQFEVLVSSRLSVEVVVQKQREDEFGNVLQPAVTQPVATQITGNLRYTLTPVGGR